MAGMTTASNVETLSTISAQLTHMFKPGFKEVLNDELGLWNILPRHASRREAVRVKFHISRNTGGGAVAETDGAGTAVAQGFISAFGDYAIYTKPVEITDFAQAKAMAAGHGNYEAWADESARAATDMRQDIEKALNAFQTGDNAWGVPDWMDDGTTTASIFGLTRAAYPFLKCVQVDGESAVLSFVKLRELVRKMRHGTGADITGTSMTFYSEDQGGGRPGVHITTPALEEAYEALVTANNRYPMTAGMGGGAIDPGLSDLIYKRAPVLGSRFAPTGTWWSLDVNQWGIEILPQAFTLPSGQRAETDFALIVEGRADQKVKAYWRLYFQLICEAPWKQGKIYDLSEVSP